MLAWACRLDALPPPHTTQFPDNQAIRFFPQGVMAFHITGGGNRFDGCYIDGSRAVFVGARGGRASMRARALLVLSVLTPSISHLLYPPQVAG